MDRHSKKEIRRIMPICKKILGKEEEFSVLTDDELKNKTMQFKERIENGTNIDELIVDAFATCREAAKRVLGMTAYPVQLLGGILLHQGRMTELKTGEGKTMVELFPAYLNALSGKGVHIVTVNDYLAQRDSEQMGKVFKYLGLTVGLIKQDAKPLDRQYAYACDITYGTSNQFGFDYLRDNMATSITRQVQRGHNYVIIDEVDSILIDEAKTPLIIAGQGTEKPDEYIKADNFVKSLKGLYIPEDDHGFDIEAYLENNEDYVVQEKSRIVNMTEFGVAKAEKFYGIDNLMDYENAEIQHYINQALKANTVMRKDIDYVIENDTVQIVDENTGRILYGRRFSDGLHQAIEIKENIKMGAQTQTKATTTLQNYFRLYSKISGMSGTIVSEKEEIATTYETDVVEVPTNRPVIRKEHHDLVFKTEDAKYRAIIQDIKKRHEKGQPILVGTPNVESSEKLAALLKQEDIPFNLLNAKNHLQEAYIVAQAGKIGAITIATNMAGRGTDIKLGGNPEYMARETMLKSGKTKEEINVADSFFETDDTKILTLRKTYSDFVKKYKVKTEKEGKRVRKLGGLYVLGVERNRSERVDNQLKGRSGRQGDPGESRYYVSLEDEMIRAFGGEKIEKIYTSLKIDEDTPLKNRFLDDAINNIQKTIESIAYASRLSTLKYDDVINEQRNIIYGQRQEILDGQNMKETIDNIIHDTFLDLFDLYWPDEGECRKETLFNELIFYGIKIKDEFKNEEKDKLLSLVFDQLDDFYAQKREVFNPTVMNNFEKETLLSNVDRYWVNYIDDMNYFKKCVGLNRFAGRDPVTEFRIETGKLFDEMVFDIKSRTVKKLLTSVPVLTNTTQLGVAGGKTIVSKQASKIKV